jgi:ribonuclease P protein component
VAAKAVDRNKLKRRARAIVRELLPKIKDNYACLLFFKKEAVALTYQELKKTIQDILIHANVISF